MRNHVQFYTFELGRCVFIYIEIQDLDRNRPEATSFRNSRSRGRTSNKSGNSGNRSSSSSSSSSSNSGCVGGGGGGDGGGGGGDGGSSSSSARVTQKTYMNVATGSIIDR